MVQERDGKEDADDQTQRNEQCIEYVLCLIHISDRDAGHCSDTHSITTSAHSGTLVTEHRETALCLSLIHI